LSAQEKLLFQRLGGEEALTGGPDEEDEVDRQELIEGLYGVDWASLSHTRRRLLSVRLRERIWALNRKLAAEGLRVKRCGKGLVCLAHASAWGGKAADRGHGIMPDEDTKPSMRADEQKAQPGRISAERIRELIEKARARGRARPHRAAIRSGWGRGSARCGKSVAECAAEIRAALANGRLEATELERLCLQKGYAPGTVKRARKRLGVRAEKGPGFGAEGKWLLSMPPDKGGS
jgi:hypothetical protein